MTGPWIKLALTGDRSGYILAVLAHEGEEHLPPSQRMHMGTVLVTGNFYRRSADEEPEDWRAWLWPAADGDIHTTQHCDAIDDTATERLRDRLQKHADKQGPWWK